MTDHETTKASASYEFVLGDLEKKIEGSKRDLEGTKAATNAAKLAEEIAQAELDKLVKLHEGLLSVRPQKDEPYASLTLGNAIFQVLKKACQDLEPYAISEKIIAGGYQTKAENFKNNVIVTLNQEARKESPQWVKNGSKWGLTEWLPREQRPDSDDDEQPF